MTHFEELSEEEKLRECLIIALRRSRQLIDLWQHPRFNHPRWEAEAMAAWIEQKINPR